jgi:hypothetical protein
MSQAEARKRAEEKLARRGLKYNDAGDIVPIEDGQEPAAQTQTQEPAAQTQTQEPAAQPQDNTDYKSEFEKLKADFQALQGRLAPSQRDADTFRGLYETSSRELEAERIASQAKLDKLQQELAEATSARERKSIEAEIEDLLDDEDRATVDPSVLAVIKKVAGKFSAPKPQTFDADAEVEKALAAREKKNVDTHRNRLLADANTELGKLKTLAQDPEFNAYCEENPEVDMTLTHFLHASTTADIDRYAKAANRLISAYRTGKAPADSRVADPKSASTSVLQSALARTAAAKMSEEQLRAKTREFKQLIRNNTPESKAKAKLLMAEIEANT